jgi:hypothetical protein
VAATATELQRNDEDTDVNDIANEGSLELGAEKRGVADRGVSAAVIDAGKEDMLAELRRGGDEEYEKQHGDRQGDDDDDASIDVFSSMAKPCERCPMSELHPIVRERFFVTPLGQCMGSRPCEILLVGGTVVWKIAPLVVCACPETAQSGGALLLDPSGGPNWQLISTQSAYTIKLPQVRALAPSVVLRVMPRNSF